jgi:sulfur-carrier protein
MSMVRIVYFAWVREKIGIDGEEMILPDGVKTCAALAAHLERRGGGYSEALGDIGKLRCAVDLTMTAMDAVLNNPAEIAFFPPVTGG